MKLIKYMLFLAILLSINTLFAEDITVEAEGIGVNKMEAMNNAWTEAVRKAVGENVKASDSVIDEELTEKIVTYSRGRLNAYKIIDQQKDNDIWKIKISANIEKEILNQTANSNNKNITNQVEIDEIKEKTGNDNIDKKDDSLDIPWDKLPECITYKAELLTDKAGKHYCCHFITINDNYKKIFYPVFENYLSKYSKKSNKATISDNNNEKSNELYKEFIKDNYKKVLDIPNLNFNWANKYLLGITFNSSIGIDTGGYFSRPYDREDKESNVWLFKNYKNYTKYVVDEKYKEELLKILDSQKYEISFYCKAKIDGKEKVYDTHFMPIAFFCKDLKNKYKIGIDIIPWPIFKDSVDYLHETRVCCYINEINITLEELSKLEGMEFSYEIQKAFDE